MDIKKPVPNSIQVGGTHYLNKTIQPWDALESWMTHEQFVGYLAGNAIKYLSRFNDKGNSLEDINKAIHYLNKLADALDDSEDNYPEF